MLDKLSQNTLTIRRCNSDDSTLVTELRLDCYGKAKEFSLAEPHTLAWSKDDEKGIVLGIWDGPSLLATMKGEVLESPYDAQRVTECVFDAQLAEFPALLLGKAATKLSEHGTGFNSALRLKFLRLALALELNSVLGIVFAGAPRTRLLAKLGYTLRPVGQFYYTDLVPSKETLLASLAGGAIPDAIKILESELSQLPCNLHWFGGPLELNLS